MDNDALLATFALLGGWQPPPVKPREAALELTPDGWQVWDGQSFEPLPVHCDIAWEIAEKDTPGSGAVVMEQTRKLCGELRITAKRPHIGRARRAELEQTLKDLRDGMSRARALPSRETDQPKET